jgi:hypothetical protein
VSFPGFTRWHAISVVDAIKAPSLTEQRQTGLTLAALSACGKAVSRLADVLPFVIQKAALITRSFGRFGQVSNPNNSRMLGASKIRGHRESNP